VRPGSSSPATGSQLFFIADQGSRRRFLVDTGFSFSIIPHRSSAPATGPALRSANNACIRCWDQKTGAVTINGQPLQYQFLLADIRFPILGIDFLRHYKLVVDVCAEQLLPRTALAQPVGGDIFAVQQQACLPAAGSSEWDSILAEFSGVS
jgi:predicted aspartyl protease